MCRATAGSPVEVTKVPAGAASLLKACRSTLTSSSLEGEEPVAADSEDSQGQEVGVDADTDAAEAAAAAPPPVSAEESGPINLVSVCTASARAEVKQEDRTDGLPEEGASDGLPGVASWLPWQLDCCPEDDGTPGEGDDERTDRARMSAGASLATSADTRLGGADPTSLQRARLRPKAATVPVALGTDGA